MNLFPYKNHILILAAVGLILSLVFYKYYKSKENMQSSISDSKNTTGLSVTMFYSDNCGACTHAKPEWEKFKEMTQGKVNHIEIRAESDQGNELCKENKIRFFPTVRVYRNDKEGTFLGEYSNGDSALTAESLHKFVASFI
jgi:thiol-disulfide isomerase/thioredoxin